MPMQANQLHERQRNLPLSLFRLYFCKFELKSGNCYQRQRVAQLRNLKDKTVYGLEETHSAPYVLTASQDNQAQNSGKERTGSSVYVGIIPLFRA